MCRGQETDEEGGCGWGFEGADEEEGEWGEEEGQDDGEEDYWGWDW